MYMFKICIYTYIYIYKYIYIIYMYTHRYTYIFTCMYIHIHICLLFVQELKKVLMNCRAQVRDETFESLTAALNLRAFSDEQRCEV